MKKSRRQSLRRLSVYVAASVGALLLAIAILILMFGGMLLNGYGKQKIERAFAKAHPGCALRIGELDYSVGADRLVAKSVTLSATNMTLKAGRISLTGARWARLLRGTADLADVLAKASLDTTNLDVEFPQSHYGIRCARLRASVLDSDLIAEGTELRTLVGDKHSLQLALIERRGFIWSCRSAECWGWRMLNCSRESRTGPSQFAFPKPPSMRWSIVTSRWIRSRRVRSWYMRRSRQSGNRCRWIV